MFVAAMLYGMDLHLHRERCSFFTLLYGMRCERCKSTGVACDHAVISDSPARRAEYAECLLRFARLNLTQESSSWGIDFAASHLTLRVHSILADEKSPGWPLYVRIASGITIFALFLSLAPY